MKTKGLVLAPSPMTRGATVVVVAAMLFALGVPARAQDGAGRRRTPDDARRQIDKSPGTVYTYYGLRKLEDDPSVSEEEKVAEWKAFIKRSRKQLRYAERAIKRWKKAGQRRLIASVRDADRDGQLSPRKKIDRWSQIGRLFPKTAEARTARRRIAFWTKEETKRLVLEAEQAEKGRRPRLERIKAWEAVLAWAKRGPESRAARRRIQVLQKQLYKEAVSVDRTARIDKQAKLDAWRDVLDGRPTRAQRNKARRRVRALSAELSGE